MLAIFTADDTVDTVVLGAWGCGVFNPGQVAQDWRELLETRFAGAFRRVIFAVLGQSFGGFVAGFEGKKGFAQDENAELPAAAQLRGQVRDATASDAAQQ